MNKEAKIQLRLPAPVRDWLRVFAAKHNRSMNGQMIVLIQEAKAREESQNASQG